MPNVLGMDHYQEAASATAVYPEGYGVIYTAMKLSGEAGETTEKVAKLLRDTDWRPGQPLPMEAQDMIVDELGDVLWYVAMLAQEAGIPLSSVAGANLEKLQDRADRGVIQGSGDNR